MTDLLSGLSGTIVGFILALVGGSGSVLAVPLLVYGVGVTSAHVAIGTSAVAVCASALANLVGHARAGNVKWRCGLVLQPLAWRERCSARPLRVLSMDKSCWPCSAC
jgi:uncharacterized membrane protein YfcA